MDNKIWKKTEKTKSVQEEFMALAVQQAEKGMGFTSPNPMVGAVIVKNGKVISADFHHKYGEFHAERNAILNCTEDMHGAQLYVTLEPCCHFGKTPPCTQIIIESGISEVFVGSADPNPLVAGKGCEQLRNVGITVHEGILKEECDRLNRIFFHYITHDTPYVIYKYAMTADGKTSSHTGASQWISGEGSRRDVQGYRLLCSGIMVGINTVLADDPRLTCRLEKGRDPVRVICDSNLKIPLDSYIVKTSGEVPTVIACCKNASPEKAALLKKAGAEVFFTESEKQVELSGLMGFLHSEKHMDSLLLEGGSQLAFSMLEAGLVNEVVGYIAPKLLGGKNANSPVGGAGFEIGDSEIKLSAPRITQIGDDIKLEWEVSG